MEHITRLQLWEYLDGESDGDNAEEIKTHLRSCPLCMEEYNLLMEVETGMRAVIPPPPAKGFALKVTAKVIEKRSDIISPAKKIFLFTLACSVVIYFVILFIFLQKNNEPPNVFNDVSSAYLHWVKMIAQVMGCLFFLFLFDLVSVRKRHIS